MNIYSSIGSNIRKTWIIIALFIVFISTLGYVYGQADGGVGYAYAGIALVFSALTSIGSYFYSDKIVLASTHAKEVDKKTNPLLYNTVENLAIATGQPMPRVYIVEDMAMNAFATGRDPKHAVVAVTRGLLEKLNKVELEGVIAHELSHVNNYDTRLITMVAVLVGAVVILGDLFIRGNIFRGSSDDNKGNSIFLIVGIIFAILSPIIAILVQLAISRKREFLADASGALITRYPEGLASALEKISQDKKPVKNASNATASLFFTNPFSNKQTIHFMANLFNTHPPVEERIKILRKM